MTEMRDRAPPPYPAEKVYPAEKARGGEIILRTPLRRAIFIGGAGRSGCAGTAVGDCPVSTR